MKKHETAQQLVAQSQKKEMRIYISGPITGLPEEEVIAAFSDAQKELGVSGNWPDSAILNPIELGDFLGLNTEDHSHADFMRVDLSELLLCTDIYMLRGWHRSKGAVLELSVARGVGIEVNYQAGALHVDKIHLQPALI